MIRPPEFASSEDHRRSVVDVDFWWPYIRTAVERHGLLDAGRDPVPGDNPTHPTFQDIPTLEDLAVELFAF